MGNTKQKIYEILKQDMIDRRRRELRMIENSKKGLGFKICGDIKDCVFDFVGREMMRDGDDPEQSLSVFIRYRCIEGNHDYLAFESNTNYFGVSQESYWENFESNHNVRNGYTGPVDDEGGSAILMRFDES